MASQATAAWLGYRKANRDATGMEISEPISGYRRTEDEEVVDTAEGRAVGGVSPVSCSTCYERAARVTEFGWLAGPIDR